MKTLKVYLLSASLLLAGFGIASAQQSAKMKGDKKGGDKKGSTNMAIKSQGTSSKVNTGTTGGAKKTDAKPTK